jgi:bd-type cytochrome oxidase subunit II
MGDHDGRLLHSVLWRSVRQRGDVNACYQPNERQHSRFTLPLMLSLAPLPLIAAAAWVGTLRSLSGQHDWAPLVCAILLFLASLGELGASVWPHAIPCVLNIWDPASEHRTQVISLFAFAGVVPVYWPMSTSATGRFEERSARHEPGKPSASSLPMKSFALRTVPAASAATARGSSVRTTTITEENRNEASPCPL